MKIIELVAKVEKLSMQEIDELVDNGIEIEDIQYILLHDDKNMNDTLFENEKYQHKLSGCKSTGSCFSDSSKRNGTCAYGRKWCGKVYPDEVSVRNLW